MSKTTSAQVYPGPPEHATAGLFQDIRDRGEEPLSATWMGSSLLVLWRTPRRHGVDKSTEFITMTLSFVAVVVFAVAGLQMLSIETIGGDTIMEAFYHAVGVMCFGLATLSIIIGIKQ